MCGFRSDLIFDTFWTGFIGTHLSYEIVLVEHNAYRKWHLNILWRPTRSFKPRDAGI